MLLVSWLPVSNCHNRKKKQERIKSYKNWLSKRNLTGQCGYQKPFKLKQFQVGFYRLTSCFFLHPIVKPVNHTARLLFTITCNLFC